MLRPTGDGITINADGVTLDLRGFTITSSASSASDDAIDVNGSDVAIFNGHIVSGTTYSGGTFSGPGFAYGIYASSSIFRNIRIRDVSVQGCSLFGIYCAHLETSLVESCTVSVSGSVGIQAGVVRDCVVHTSGGAGIAADTVANSRAESVASTGISAENVLNCYGVSTSTSGFPDGILAFRSVHNSYGLSAGDDGINCAGQIPTEAQPAPGRGLTASALSSTSRIRLGIRTATTEYPATTSSIPMETRTQTRQGLTAFPPA